jgi:deoxyribose-phosphate aldolase
VSPKPTLIQAATIASLKDGSTLKVTRPYLVTPSAADLAGRKGVTIEVVAESELSSALKPQPQSTTPVTAASRSLASRIDSTLLAADATPDQITRLCEEAQANGFAAVCVNPIHVALAVKTLAAGGPVVAAVCGFPLGANASSVKAAEARLAADQGAREIDMVLPLGALKTGHWTAVRDDVEAVRDAFKYESNLLKVIIEAPLLTDSQKVAASIVAVEAKADYIKTGTGYSGPATVSDVALIRQAIGDRARIKAAGGIRERRTAEALIAAGADRLGTSHASALLA